MQKSRAPLSLILFITALEWLEIKIKVNHKLQCMRSGTCEVKLLLYADEILLFISDCQKSFPYILEMVFNFRKCSWHKSIGLNLGGWQPPKV